MEMCGDPKRKVVEINGLQLIGMLKLIIFNLVVYVNYMLICS